MRFLKILHKKGHMGSKSRLQTARTKTLLLALTFFSLGILVFNLSLFQPTKDLTRSSSQYPEEKRQKSIYSVYVQ